MDVRRENTDVRWVGFHPLASKHIALSVVILSVIMLSIVGPHKSTFLIKFSIAERWNFLKYDSLPLF